MGLARGGVTEQGPVAAVIVVADHKVKTCEHGKEKSLELQEGVTPVGGQFGGTELGPLGLGREGEGLVIGGHFRLLPSSRVRCSGVVRERGSPVEVPFRLVTGREALCLSAVRSRACVDTWASAASGGSFRAVAPVTVWVLGLLIRKKHVNRSHHTEF